MPKLFHQRAAAAAGRTLTDTYAEFVSAWKAVKFAAGDDVVKLAWDIVRERPLPPRPGTTTTPGWGN